MEIVLAVIGSGALSALISGIFTLLHSHKRRDNGVVSGVKQLLYDRIKYLGRSHLKNEKISSEDLEDIIQMHKIYHDALGGNGYLDSIMDQVRRLPIER